MLARAFALLALLAAGPTGADELLARGEYVLRAAGCVSCHTATEDDAPFLAGGRAIESPFGTFYGPNITPDAETGIGGWTREDLERALREGRAPDGRHYYPAFPYTSYTRIRDEDLDALWAYLESVEPVRRENRGHELAWYVRLRGPLRFWKALNFRPGPFEPSSGQSEEFNRGAYLVAALGHCAECHSPRTATGGIDEDLRLAGGRMPSGDIAPNLTPDPETGIGRWRGRHIARYLEFGMDPEGDFAGGHMSEVIEQGTSHLTDADRQAIAVYLMALEPIEHRP